MKQFKVIDPKGFLFGGKVLKPGTVFQAQNKSAHIQTGLHFKQIAPAKASESEVDAEPVKPEVAPEEVAPEVTPDTGKAKDGKSKWK